MKWFISSGVLDDDGLQLFSFGREEIVVVEDEADHLEVLEEVAQELLDSVDAAKVSLGKQIAATAANLRRDKRG